MFDGEMRALVEAHIECQLGCYFSHVVGQAEDTRYLYSDIIPDTSWNFCIPQHGTAKEVEWGSGQAAAVGREAAFFVPSADAVGLSGSLQHAPERWMVREQEIARPPTRPAAVTDLREIRDADPGGDFATVFANLFPDQAINDHFSAYYVPALRAARRASSAQPVHLVAFEGDEPVACASLYLVGDYAGLYNVGAIASRQRQGLGAWISSEILKHANGRSIFLQCECGTHVERMYMGLGFSILSTPEIVTVSAPNG